MTISVSQLNNYLKALVDMDGVLTHIEVKGEVTNVRPSGQYLYFSLKDDYSQIDCFAYSNEVALPVAGTIVVANGAINFLTKSGKISFFVRKLEDTSKQGDSYLRFIALRDKLNKEGLFDQSRKKSIPSYCATIGVISSKTGAVIRDIQDVVFRRQPSADIVLYPVRVQGLFAVKQIREAIQYFNNSIVDVVIIARGGGSDEDLSVFNDEDIVRAVANCTKPTVSAIGHGIDFTLTDFAADRRAVTPTEAGEFVSIDSRRIQDTVARLIVNNRNSILRRINDCSASVRNTLSEIQAHFVGAINKIQYTVMQTEVMSLVALQRKLDNRQAQFDLLTQRASVHNPMEQLKRGYSIISKGSVRVSSVSQLSVGEELNIRLSDGSAQATVTKILEINK